MLRRRLSPQLTAAAGVVPTRVRLGHSALAQVLALVLPAAFPKLGLELAVSPWAAVVATCPRMRARPTLRSAIRSRAMVVWTMRRRRLVAIVVWTGSLAAEG